MSEIDINKVSEPAVAPYVVKVSDTVRKVSLAERREALVAECSRQRTHMSREIGGLRAPTLHGGSLMDSLLGGNMKIVMTVAATVLGVIAMRPAGLMPLVHTGMGLLRMSKSVLAMVRKTTA